MCAACPTPRLNQSYVLRPPWEQHLRYVPHRVRNGYNKVKCSRYRPGVAQRVGRGIAVLFHDRGTRRGWMVSSTPRLHFTPGKDAVPVLQEAGWAPGPVWTGGKCRPYRDSMPERPARSSVTIPTELPAPHPHIRLGLIPHTTLMIYPFVMKLDFVLCETGN